MAFSAYTNRNVKDIFAEFYTSAESGLSSAKVLENKKTHGLNDVAKKDVGALDVFIRQFKSIFIYLLMGAGGLTLVLGEYIDAALIFLFIAIDVGLGFYQEYKSERTISLLKGYLASRAKVRRGGHEEIIDAKEVTLGDIVILQAGDAIPADIRFFKVNDMLVDESSLTGESAPVRKTDSALPLPISDMYKAENIGFAGTNVVEGYAEGVVIAIGKDRVISDIVASAPDIFKENDFEKGITSFSKLILGLVAITLIIVFVVNAVVKEGFDYADFLIFAIALAISVVPEALPLVVTFSLSAGAMKLVKKHVVVKKLSAIENLGSIDILCTDKTGTLTENKMAVAEIYSKDPSETIVYANLCNIVGVEHIRGARSSFDAALYDRLTVADKEKIAKYKKIAEIPFDPNRRRNSVLVEVGGEKELVVVGSPESIIPHSVNMRGKEKDEAVKWVEDEGLKGRRVVAVAKKHSSSDAEYEDTEEESGLIVIGIVSFTDPIKPSTKAAIEEAKRLNVAVKIITGDSRGVAGAVAHEIGLIDDPKKVITGDELEALPESKQHDAAMLYSVFARVSPKQKFKIIDILKKKDHVGFLGEGMNDVPALKSADVSLVVENAADIARDAADIILLQKNLYVIMDGIRTGREVFTNIIKYIKATLSSNLGNFYAVAIVSLMIDYLPMLPLQILLVNLLSDFPMMTVATDNVERFDIKKPKQYDVREIIIVAIVLGLVSTVFDFIFFAYFNKFGEATLQTNWFVGSILTELVLLFSIRTTKKFWKARMPSGTLVAFSAMAFAATIAIPFTSIGEQVFKFVRPTGMHILVILGIVAAYFVITETVKLLLYRFLNSADDRPHRGLAKLKAL